MRIHNYRIKVEWTGNKGSGTENSKSFNRYHQISADGKYDLIHGSSDPAFLGDKTKYNPEDLLVSAISACHMLCYLHLCSVNKIVVTEYIDDATGIMEETGNGSGKFREVTLNPAIKITDANLINKAIELHSEANKMCFIANSCNFAIRHEPDITVVSPTHNKV